MYNFCYSTMNLGVVISNYELHMLFSLCDADANTCTFAQEYPNGRIDVQSYAHFFIGRIDGVIVGRFSSEERASEYCERMVAKNKKIKENNNHIA